ncbi:hypothetical protein AcW1_002409 [Taiwanofungus camphoratus]|nr:hypothetical protein AcW1_002409 [Antrodia cinnamomea]
MVGSAEGVDSAVGEEEILEDGEEGKREEGEERRGGGWRGRRSGQRVDERGEREDSEQDAHHGQTQTRTDASSRIHQQITWGVSRQRQPRSASLRVGCASIAVSAIMRAPLPHRHARRSPSPAPIPGASLPASAAVDMLPMTRSTIVTYLVSFAAIVLTVVLILLVVLAARLRRRRHHRTLDARLVLKPPVADPQKDPEKAAYAPHADSVLPIEQAHLSRSQSDSACVPPGEATHQQDAFPCACPDCLVRINGIPFVLAHPPHPALRRPTPARASASRTAPNLAFTRTAARTHSRPAAPPDENAHRDASVHIPPSPPLSPHQHAWVIEHGPLGSFVLPSVPSSASTSPSGVGSANAIGSFASANGLGGVASANAIGGAVRTGIAIGLGLGAGKEGHFSSLTTSLARFLDMPALTPSPSLPTPAASPPAFAERTNTSHDAEDTATASSDSPAPLDVDISPAFRVVFPRGSLPRFPARTPTQAPGVARAQAQGKSAPATEADLARAWLTDADWLSLDSTAGALADEDGDARGRDSAVPPRAGARTLRAGTPPPGWDGACLT